MNKLELAAQLQGNKNKATMALVTVQRSSSVAGSPHCSISDIDIENDNDDGNKVETNCSEGYFAGQETALVVDLKDIPQPAERRLSTDSTRSTNSTQSNSSDIQQHLQSMFYLLRHGETLKMAVKLESQRPNRTRYLVITSRICFHTLTTDRKNKTGRSNSTKTASLSTPVNVVRQKPIDSNKSHIQSDAGLESTEKHISSVSFASDAIRVSPKYEIDRNSASGDRKCSEGIEESCLLGIDCNERATIGLVVPILADTTIHLDGDGGFSVAVYGKTHIFKPVSVQAMWSALQTLHKVSHKARENNFYPGGPSHEWLSYYESRIESDQSCLNEWNAMDSIESRRPPSPDAIRNKPTEKEETECVIKMKLKEIMMSVDLDEVTSKYIRVRLEELLDMDLGEYKSFIDQEMLTILGQMDAPTEIFEHVYLGSEWNASNLEELQKNGVRHILNVTREIDNFFPGMFNYFNVRVYDDEKTNLLKHWDNTFRYINRAKNEGSKVLVHCKMGVSRSASVVIAYAMKAYNWEFQQAMQHVKERRNCIKPNKNFLNQLETYRGMLDAMKNKEKLQRSKSETNLKSTKDARLLPGSEPTPLIQALNQSKSKALGVGGDGVEVSDGIVSVRSISSASDHKQRRVMRRSSSTSPKSIQNHIAIVIKQQSQSLENLTPERNVADEPKNVRFPGNNGENYSVTQNQVLHIQKNTATSVKTIVNDLESFQERKTVDDRKSLNLLISRSNSVEASNLKTVTDHELQTRTKANNGKLVSSPVWTSSTKLITQLSTLSSQYGSEISTVPQMRSSIRLRRDTNSDGSSDVFSSQVDNVFEKEEVRHTRKTQSWAPRTCSNITVPAAAQTLSHTAAICSRQSSNSSIDSMATARHYEVFGCPRARQREFLSRHSSWGSGDQRSSLIARNSSWGAYDTNRNTFQYGSSATTAAAIIEGQIHELNMSNKTDSTAGRVDTKMENCAEPNTQHTSTVKRTKLKLEESTILKKLCQENGTDATAGAGTAGHKRTSNLYRSQSAAAATRTRFSNRCNSEEIMSHSSELVHRPYARRSDGSKPFHTELFSASAPDSYTISDIENKNTLQDHSDAVELRHSSVMDDQRMSGNVQILKKNFELKAGGNKSAASTTKKGQSLPSSPVAQHVDHLSNADVTASTYFSVQTNAAKAPCYATGSNLSSEAITDCNVKGLVHRYQATSACIKVHSAAYAPSTSSTGFGTFSSSANKTRPRSYYENRHSTSTETQQNLGKPPHGYNDCRPPPAPLKSTYTISSASSATRSHSMKDGISTHNQQRRLQQHGKTHPLARLSLPKQSFNAAAYNTM